MFIQSICKKRRRENPNKKRPEETAKAMLECLPLKDGCVTGECGGGGVMLELLMVLPTAETQRLFQHTKLEHTPKKPLPTGYKGIPFIVG